MVSVVIGILLALSVKHYVADYLLQTSWIIAGKGSFSAPGGYAHAGIHAVFSLGILIGFSVPVGISLAIAAAEFVVHYLLDYGKIHYSQGVHADREPQRFWGLFGLDQLFHQLTYIAMLYGALWARGLV